MRSAEAKNRQLRKSERFELRLTSEQQKLIARAATLCGMSAAEFVVATALAAATNAIGKCRKLSLAGKARKAFVDAVLNPPPPNEAARAAAKRYVFQHLRRRAN